MSRVAHQVSDRQVAANQSNAEKSTGPKTPQGKARVALNAIKHGAYAKADNVRRHLMARRGEDTAEYEQLHRDLVDSCQPEDALQAMVVKTIGDKTWDKLKLRRTSLEGQLGSVGRRPQSSRKTALSLWALCERGDREAVGEGYVTSVVKYQDLAINLGGGNGVVRREAAPKDRARTGEQSHRAL